MKRLLSVCLSLCIMVSVFVSFDITASAKTTMKKTTVSASNISNGINVSWKKVSGAKSYKVYRKAPGAKKYSVVKKTNNKTVKYLDKKVSAGKTYSYQVVAVKGKDYSKSKTKSITRLLAPQNVKVQSYASKTDCTLKGSKADYVFDTVFPVERKIGVKITWNKSKGANKYDIYRKIGNSKKYRKIKTVGNISTYVDNESFFSALNLSYKVVARKNNSASDYSATRKICYVEPAGLMAFSLTDSLKVTWSQVAGCDGYRLYRSLTGKAGSYSFIGKYTTKEYKYEDKNAELGKTYYYKLLAYKGSNNSVGLTIKEKYEPVTTVNLNVGDTSDSVQKQFKKTLAKINKDLKQNMSDLYQEVTFDKIMESVRIESKDEKVATVSKDYIITAVSQGTIKAPIIQKLGNFELEKGFILINVN